MVRSSPLATSVVLSAAEDPLPSPFLAAYGLKKVAIDSPTLVLVLNPAAFVFSNKTCDSDLTIIADSTSKGGGISVLDNVIFFFFKAAAAAVFLGAGCDFLDMVVVAVVVFGWKEVCEVVVAVCCRKSARLATARR